jgi:hypothetical protein
VGRCCYRSSLPQTRRNVDAYFSLGLIEASMLAMTNGRSSKGCSCFSESLPRREKGRTVRELSIRAALREDAAELLGELGGTPGEVGLFLTTMGVRVYPAIAGDSPLARYLYSVIGPDMRVKRIKVTTGWLVLRTRRRWWSTICVRIPDPARKFVATVDNAPDDYEIEVPSAGNQGELPDR